MFQTTDFTNWFGGGTRTRELDETRARWNEVEALWERSPLATTSLEDLSVAVMKRVFKACDRLPAFPIIEACAWAAEELLRAEDILPLEADWDILRGDVEAAVQVRELLVRRRRWAADFDRTFEAFTASVVDAFVQLFRQLPESCFREWSTEHGQALGVPLVELLERPAEEIERCLLFSSTEETVRLDLFNKLRQQLLRNVVVASGFPPSTLPDSVMPKLVVPTRLKGKAPSELVTEYLEFTPLRWPFEVPVPFEVPLESRFEHCHILGGTGHGKTQLMQRMIHDDLVAAQNDGRSVVVIDSQGDLINKLMRLELFSPDVEKSLADRLVLIDPSDIEYPAALNLFDAHLDRTEGYSAVDREKVLNGVVELYETFFGAMLGAELTQKQGVIFRYLARLMVAIPGATIHTLMQIMEDGAPYKSYMGNLEGSARHFFATEFFHPSLAATKKQILRRLWGVLSTPAFERMFIQPENKLDLYQAMNDGKIILVSTAKDLLKADGSALLGRFFIAMIAQAALERSVIPAEKRTPTFVYVDEAHEYFDDNVEAILNQARKYRVGLTLAHQALDQLSPRLRATLHTNTSLKFAGGVSAHDARAIAQELHTTAEFVESMRRRPDRSEFAAWLKGMTPTALRLSAPLGYLERQPTQSEEALDDLLHQNRLLFGGTVKEPPISQGIDTPSDSSSSAPPPPTESGSDAAKSEVQRGSRLAFYEEQTSRPRLPAQDHELGKGGRKHRYLQSLIKELGEQHGYRATIEAPVEGGQIDVVLVRDGVRAAFEVTVTTRFGWERDNIRKCLDAGYEHVAVVMAKSESSRARFQAAVLADFNDLERAHVTCMSPEDLPEYIAAISTPKSAESHVKGYRVRVTHSSLCNADVATRRNTISRIVCRSLNKSVD